MNYLQDLQVLKSSFIGGGEGAFYLKVLERLPEPHVDWLDIGCGRDAKILMPFIDFCTSRGHTLFVTGIDPDAGVPPANNDLVSWKIIRGRFDDWEPDSEFHVVNADQSLYYLDNPSCQMERIADLLHANGLFIATCWSIDDTLHQIRGRLFPDASQNLVGEQLIPSIEYCSRLELIDTSTFRTQVDLGMWRKNRELLEAAIRIIARAEVRGRIDYLAERLIRILEEFPTHVPRVNMAIAARRVVLQR